MGRWTPNPPEASTPRSFDDFEVRLGDLMRGERATLGKSLIDVQRELKIKATYIAAIENADASAFDTPGFIAGYVRSYARYLGMDPEWVWDRFCAEAGFEVPHGLSAAASSPKPVRRTGLEALGDPNASFVPRGESWLAAVEPRAFGSLFVLIALIGAIGYGAWSVLKEVQRVQISPVEQAPGVPTDIAGLTGPGGPVQPAASAEFAAPAFAAPVADSLDRLYRPPALDVPVMVARDRPIAAVDPSTVGAFAGILPPPEVVEQVAEAVPEELAGPQVLAPEAAEVAIVAVRPAWVRVSAADGTVLLEKILEPGERWAVPATEEAPQLRAGNSGAVYFLVNGQTHGPAAPGAQVVRSVVLSADTLAETYDVADFDADPDLAAVAVADAAAAAATAAAVPASQ